MNTAESEQRDRAFRMLRAGMRHAEVAKELEMSIDRVKRLSRLRVILENSREKLSNEAYMKLEGLGFKALELSKTVRERDFDGLKDILTCMPQNVLKKDVRLYVDALERKNRHVSIEDSRLESSLNWLDRNVEACELQALMLRRTAQRQKKVRKAIKSCKNRHVKKFLEDHMGFYQGYVALKRRIDSGWLEELSSAGIIELKRDTENHYGYDVRVIMDLERFIKSLETRYENRKKTRRQPVWIWWTPKPLDYDAEKEFNAHLEKIRELQDKKAERMEEFKRVKNAPLDGFMNAVEGHEEPHDPKVIQAVARYFCDRGYVVAQWDENTLLGYNECKSVIAARLPAHRHAETTDWKGVKGVCERMYEVRTGWMRQSDGQSCGIVEVSGNKRLKVEIVLEAPVVDLDGETRKKTVFEIARRASRKMIFG